MSEYQYYEFQKADGRLSEQDQQELRAYSTRARITAASFINEYEWGSFKGNADLWMEKYFDGYLYLANWGTREVQLAVPAGLLPLKTAQRYRSGQVAASRRRSGKLILTFLSEDDFGEDWIEGEGHLSSLLQIRNELAQGDIRSLYLGWLLGVQAGEFDEAEKEPPVPPNLDVLSGPQENLAEFLRLDPDLLAAAAQISPRAQAEVANSHELSDWVVSLRAQEKDEILRRLMTGEEAKLRLELQSRFYRQRTPHTFMTATPKPRTVAELLAAAERRGRNRHREQAQKAALEKERQAQAATIARERHLNSLKGRGDVLWASVESLVATRQPKRYDEAVQHLGDLSDLAELEGKQADFNQRLALFRRQHAAKQSLLGRLAQFP